MPTASFGASRLDSNAYRRNCAVFNLANFTNSVPFNSNPVTLFHIPLISAPTARAFRHTVYGLFRFTHKPMNTRSSTSSRLPQFGQQYSLLIIAVLLYMPLTSILILNKMNPGSFWQRFRGPSSLEPIGFDVPAPNNSRICDCLSITPKA
jgi:hypothetical protein